MITTVPSIQRTAAATSLVWRSTSDERPCIADEVRTYQVLQTHEGTGLRWCRNTTQCREADFFVLDEATGRRTDPSAFPYAAQDWFVVTGETVRHPAPDSCPSEGCAGRGSATGHGTVLGCDEHQAPEPGSWHLAASVYTTLYRTYGIQGEHEARSVWRRELPGWSAQASPDGSSVTVSWVAAAAPSGFAQPGLILAAAGFQVEQTGEQAWLVTGGPRPVARYGPIERPDYDREVMVRMGRRAIRELLRAHDGRVPKFMAANLSEVVAILAEAVGPSPEPGPVHIAHALGADGSVTLEGPDAKSVARLVRLIQEDLNVSGRPGADGCVQLYLD